MLKSIQLLRCHDKEERQSCSTHKEERFAAHVRSKFYQELFLYGIVYLCSHCKSKIKIHSYHEMKQHFDNRYKEVPMVINDHYQLESKVS